MKICKSYQVITNVAATCVLLAAQAGLANATTVPILPEVQKYAPAVSAADRKSVV